MCNRDTFKRPSVPFCPIDCVSRGYEFAQGHICDKAIVMITHLIAGIACPLDALDGASCNSTFSETPLMSWRGGIWHAVPAEGANWWVAAGCGFINTFYYYRYCLQETFVPKLRS